MREHARLRSSIAEEPSSGYAYHDAVRVETVRSSRASMATKPANDATPVKRAAKATMIGLGAPTSEAPPTDPAPARRAPLSEPPDVGSWPPMPSVPPELEGAAEAFAHARITERRIEDEDDFEMMPTDPPKSAAKVGGAIWEAVPSVIGSSMEPEPPEEDPAAPVHIAPLAAPPRDLVPPAPMDRESILNASYGDARLAKLEQLVERSAWEQLDKELTGQSLTPALALLQVLAKRELHADDKDKGAMALTREAIRHVAELMQVPESSPTALLIAKRLLRRNPVATASTTASTGLSVTVLAAGLAVGAGVGWVVTKLFL